MPVAVLAALLVLLAAPSCADAAADDGTPSVPSVAAHKMPYLKLSESSAESLFITGAEVGLVVVGWSWLADAALRPVPCCCVWRAGCTGSTWDNRFTARR